MTVPISPGIAQCLSDMEAERLRFPSPNPLADGAVQLALRNLYKQGETGDQAHERFSELCDAVAAMLENAESGDPAVPLKRRLAQSNCAEELLAYLCHSLLTYRDSGRPSTTAGRSRQLAQAFKLIGKKSKTPTEDQEQRIVVAFSFGYGKKMDEEATVYAPTGRRPKRDENGLIMQDYNRAAHDPRAQRRAREAGYRAAFKAWQGRDYETGTDDQKFRRIIERIMRKHYPILLKVDGEES